MKLPETSKFYAHYSEKFNLLWALDCLVWIMETHPEDTFDTSYKMFGPYSAWETLLSVTDIDTSIITLQDLLDMRELIRDEIKI